MKNLAGIDIARMSTRQRSLRELVFLSTAGAVLFAGWFLFIAWMMGFVPRVLFHVDLRRHSSVGEILLFWITGIALGGWLAFWPQMRIRDGIRQELWPESEIAPMRRMVNRIFGVICVAFLFAGTFLMVKRIHGEHTFVSAYLSCVSLLSQWANRLSNAIGPRPVSSTSLSRERLFADMAPIQSEHWGER